MTDIRLATWNVNSLKVRLPQLLDWLNGPKGPDAVVLQETKLVDELFPEAELKAAGWSSVFCGQKTYNGVALLTRDATVERVEDVTRNMPGYPDEQKRFIAATLHFKAKDAAPIRFIGVYCPNGMATGSWKYLYKLDWFRALECTLRDELARFERVALAGDFNITPDDRDLFNPIDWGKQSPASPAERAAFKRLLALGLTDGLRLFSQEGARYTWWDYRNGAFEKNHGMRIDLVLLSKALAEQARSVEEDTEPRHREKPSDHCPVVAVIQS